MIKLGEVVRSKVSGFQGTVIGRTEWLTSSPSLEIQPTVNSDGDYRNQSRLDEDECEVVPGSKPVGIRPWKPEPIMVSSAPRRVSDPRDP